MGRKAIGRMAAGACSICLCYGLVVQAVQGRPTPVEQSIDTALVGQSLASTEELPAADRFSEENPSVEEEQEPRFDYEVPRRHGHGGRGHRWQEDGESDGWEPYHQKPAQEPSDTEEDEDKKKKTEEQTDSSDSKQNSSASGDPPTLNQFLSALRCGGCGHNCSLLNPRCMRGRSKSERAQTEYAQTYGSDSK